MSMLADQMAGLDPDRLSFLAEHPGESVLSTESFDLISRMYWVSAWKDEHELAGPSMWCFSVFQPLKVANPDMYWRRPTYAEAVVRQACYFASIGWHTSWWTGSSDYWVEYVVKGAGRFAIPEAPWRAWRR